MTPSEKTLGERIARFIMPGGIVEISMENTQETMSIIKELVSNNESVKKKIQNTIYYLRNLPADGRTQEAWQYAVELDQALAQIDLGKGEG